MWRIRVLKTYQDGFYRNKDVWKQVYKGDRDLRSSMKRGDITFP